MIDQSKKNALIRKIRRIQGQSHSGVEIVLSIDDYFVGDDTDCCTILANTTNPLSPQDLRQFLKHIEAKKEVSHVLIRFYDYEDALDFDDSWINSDTVFVITSASLADVEEWFESLEPSSASEECEIKKFANLPHLPNGHKVIAVWWD